MMFPKPTPKINKHLRELLLFGFVVALASIISLPQSLQASASTSNNTGDTDAAAKSDKLFDTTLKVDSDSASSIKDLRGIVTFTSFGKLVTNINMRFSILDEQGMVVWQEAIDDTVAVKGEAVFTKHFQNIPELPLGRYTLKLHTVHNGNMEDDLTAGFTIVQTSYGSLRWIYPLLLLLLIVLVVAGITRRKKKRGKRK